MITSLKRGSAGILFLVLIDLSKIKNSQSVIKTSHHPLDILIMPPQRPRTVYYAFPALHWTLDRLE